MGLLFRGMMAAGVVALTVLGAEGGAASARRDVIDVFHGPKAISRAIRRADPGDVLRIHRGRYRETLEIDKSLTLKAVGAGRVTVDGRCRTRVTIDVTADNVKLKSFRVIGASEGFGAYPSEVNFFSVSGGVAKDMIFKDTCDAQYGINVHDTGSMVVADSVAIGFSHAGIYIGAIAVGPVIARENEALGSIRGILVDDAAFGSVTVIGNSLHNNVAPDGETSSGISFENSDGSLIQQNRVSDNGTYGIHLNMSSDQNRVFDNAISGSGELDAFDEGTGNCWNGTTAGTSDPPVLRVC